MPDCLKTDSEITGLDRSNAEEDTSEWLELMISKKKCSVDEANAILNLLLIGVVNESTGEEGYINEYDDNSGHIAVLMNLAEDVLKIVPMKDMGWKNDGQGDRPKEFDEWVRELAEGLLKLITALIAAIGDFIAGLIEAAIEAGLKFIQAVVAAVMRLIEAIVKAALLALIYLVLALMISALTIAIINIGPVLISLALLNGGTCTFGLLFFEMTIRDYKLRMAHEIEWDFNEFLDLEVPFLVDIIEINNEVFMKLELAIFTGKSGIDLEIGENSALNNIDANELNNFFSGNLNLNTENKESDSDLKSGDENPGYLWFPTNLKDFAVFYKNIIIHLGTIPFGFFGLAGYAAIKGHKRLSVVLSKTAIAYGMALSFIFFLPAFSAISNDEKTFWFFGKRYDTASAYWGLTIACIVVGIFIHISLSGAIGLFAIILSAVAGYIIDIIKGIVLFITGIVLNLDDLKDFLDDVILETLAFFSSLLALVGLVFGKVTIEGGAGAARTSTIDVQGDFIAYSAVPIFWGIWGIITLIDKI
ncbi:MAG: hypothetical protein ACTSQS_17150 [Promethearchaeota archaeon]